MKKGYIISLVISTITALISTSCEKNISYKLFSPNTEIEIEINSSIGFLGLTQTYKNEKILDISHLGLNINGINLSDKSVVKSVSETKVDSTWKTINGKFKEIRNYYNEYVVDCEVPNNLDYQIVFRCYNDGFAYRYVFKEQENIDFFDLTGETSELRFKDNYTYWAYGGENHNFGPIDRRKNKFEAVQIPIVLKVKPDFYMAIHEAEIMRYAPFSINASGSGNLLKFNLGKTTDKLPIKTSWRTFILGTKPGDLPESNLLVNLNEACKIPDPSWIIPGKAMWDWRVSGYKTASGFKYGLNTKSHKRLIDFAAANNIQYLLIDADWYGPEFSENSDPTSAGNNISIEDCMTYAKEKGIGVILYLNDVGAKKFGLEKVLKQFHEWGVIGVKYGFMKSESLEKKVRDTRGIVELCAKYELMVDFHDSPIPPSGDRRTWPNLITKEYGHAQADARKSCYPETFVNQVFINQVSGPLDLTNGWFDLNGAKKSRKAVGEDIPSTLAAEVSKTIAIYTGWNVLPDAPEAYIKYADMFDCIKRIPEQFDSFTVLDGNLDEYVSVARRAGHDWFVGTLTNRSPREVTIDFTFLPEGHEYEATFYEDADNTDFIFNKEAYRIRRLKVDHNSMVEVKLAPGGGNAIWIRQIRNGV